MLSLNNLFWVNQPGTTADTVWRNLADPPAQGGLLGCNINTGNREVTPDEWEFLGNIGDPPDPARSASGSGPLGDRGFITDETIVDHLAPCARSAGAPGNPRLARRHGPHHPSRHGGQRLGCSRGDLNRTHVGAMMGRATQPGSHLHRFACFELSGLGRMSAWVNSQGCAKGFGLDVGCDSVALLAGQVAQLVSPTALVAYVRVDQVQGDDQFRPAFGGDQS